MHTQKQGLFSDAPVISVYTRAQAIEDGFLVDVSDSSEYKELRFRFPIALTRAVWDRYVEVPQGVWGQDLHGRLWDLLFMLRHAIRSSATGDYLRFHLHVRNDNRAGMPPLVTLKAICGPGDDAEPVITVLLLCS
ncbi:MAG: hypothetical protein IPN65_03615 [Elusimicrobia bacterium]|jgi:hypothetical protein|nr:hypothetical protein [Elusimicrobiota bacterium]MBK7208685.1 hypothetical protein [Elusimicrobiota bacterium]MBK7545427.1 hypothetical protein [Elusimicrobiota bacterium]MBK7575556.1 hypothetical protein [Elusimicrobiota bacterium]MBK7688466.1 hypothetical protein [Elusimicrobiota bacterium]